MADSDKNEGQIIQTIKDKIDTLEKRILKIETLLEQDRSRPVKVIPTHSDAGDSQSELYIENSNIESNVVEYGLAWLSSIVYFFGIIFLMTYLQNLGYSLWMSLIGYAASICIFLLSFFLRKSFPHLVFVLTISGLLLIYYVTLRLYYFDPKPLIPNSGIALIFMLIVLAGQIYYSIKRKSEFFIIMIIALSVITGLIHDSTYVTLSLLTGTSLLAIFYFSRFGWWGILFFGILFVYIAHLIWFLNNPVLGHPIKAVSEPQFSLVFLFSYAISFSSSILISKQKLVSNAIYGLIVITNALFFMILVLLEVMTFYENNYVLIFGIISLFCLIFSALLKSRTEKLFTPAFYACFGFMALSISIYGYTKFPNAYLFLAIQSLLVVSIALWYRSKIIVVVNTFLYIAILTGYLILSPSVDSINFTFAIIALATARILNWQKRRLTLKTDFLRVIYLIAGFIMVLVSLHNSIPSQYVTLSWMLAAVFYLAMSVILKNNRYRWMSILTILFTGLHLLLADMAHMEIGYRVIAFIFFAVITLGISLYYTKRIKKKTNPPDTPKST